MKFLLITIGALILAASPAFAQGKDPGTPDPAQLLMNPPVIEPANPDGSRCFNVMNKAPYSVTGSFVTDFYATADGSKGRQRLNFRLQPEEAKRYCTWGPFYPGERLELVLRTLMPVFSCYTVAQGDIVIHGKTGPDGSKSWVNCE